jgi:hypothetical protein
MTNEIYQYSMHHPWLQFHFSTVEQRLLVLP